MSSINLEKCVVVFNPRAEEDKFENTEASCSFCDSYVPAVIQLPEVFRENVPDWKFDRVYICAMCLNVLVKKLEAEMVENMRFRKAFPYQPGTNEA